MDVGSKMMSLSLASPEQGSGPGSGSGEEAVDEELCRRVKDMLEGCKVGKVLGRR